MISRYFTPLAIPSAVLLVLFSQDILAESRVTPRLELNLEFIDSETATTSESGRVTRISPGINLEAKGRKAAVSVDYSLDLLSSSGLSQDDRTNHRLNMVNTLTHIPDRWQSRLTGNISQANISSDGIQQLNPNLSSDNTRELRTLAFNTDFNGRMSQTIQFNSALDIDHADFENSENTQGYGFRLGLDNFKTVRPFSWKVEVNSRVSESDDVDEQIDTALLNLNYRFSKRFSSFIDASSTSTSSSTSSFSALDESNTLIGILWTPDRNTSFRFGAGKRGEDNSYTLSASTRTRKAFFSAVYQEQVTTIRDATLQQNSANPVFLGITQSLSILPVLEKRAIISATLNGKRSNLTLSMFQTRREQQILLGEQQILGGEQTTHGISLSFSRELSRLSSLTASVLTQQSETTQENELEGVQLGYSRTLSKRMTLNASIRNSRQDSSDLTNEYEQSSISLSLSMVF